MSERINDTSMTFMNHEGCTRTYNIGDTIYLADLYNDQVTFDKLRLTSFCEAGGCRFAYAVSADVGSAEPVGEEQYCSTPHIFHKEDALDLLRKSLKSTQHEIDKIESQGNDE